MTKSTTKAVYVDGKVVVTPVVEAAAVKQAKEIINGIEVPVYTRLTQPTHGMMLKKSLKTLHNTKFVCSEHVVRIAKSSNDDVAIYTEGATITLGNSEVARQIAKQTGALDKVDPTAVTIYHYDKQSGFVQDFKATANTDNTESKTKYIELNTLVKLNFSKVEKDLQSKYRKATPNTIAALKKQVIAKVIDMGIEIKSTSLDGKSFGQIATGAPTNNKVANLLFWSPSNQRSETAVFCTLPPQEAYEILDNVCGGAISNALGSDREISKLIKFSARIGQLGTPAIALPELGNEKYGVMIYMKEIEGPQDFEGEEQEKINNIGLAKSIDRNTYDGSVVQLDEYILEAFLALGVKMTKKQALMFAIQSRMDTLLTKVYGETKTLKNINHRRDMLLDLVDPSRVLRVPAGHVVTDEEKSNYDIIIVGNESNLGMIMDINGGKALKDIDLQTIVKGNYKNYVLDIAKASNTKLSGQALQKFVAMEGILDKLKEVLDKDLDNRLANATTGDVHPVNSDLSSFMFRHVEGGFNNRVAVESFIKTELKIAESKMSSFSLEIEAKFMRALFDDSYFLTAGKLKSLLGKNKYTGRLEAFSLDVEIEYAEQIEAIYADDSIENKDAAIAELLTGIALKYPSPSADENALLTFLTRRQLAERIAYLDLPVQDREILMDDFINTSYGAVKIAPSNTLKHRLAGMDTDYDGIAVIFERTLVEAMIAKYPNDGGKSTIIA